MRADGTGVTQLTNTPERERWPAWSPDGFQIALFREDDDEIYIMNADGTGLTNITNDDAFDARPDWGVPTPTETVAANVSIKFDDGVFSGDVDAQGDEATTPFAQRQSATEGGVCEAQRKVVLKRVRPGKDEVVGRDATSDVGKWRIRLASASPDDEYHSVAKKRSVTAPDGTLFVCVKAKSRPLRPPRQ